MLETPLFCAEPGGPCFATGSTNQPDEVAASIAKVVLRLHRQDVACPGDRTSLTGGFGRKLEEEIANGIDS